MDDQLQTLASFAPVDGSEPRATMTDQDDTTRDEVDEFLRDRIDTVPHLEALLLLWNSRPKSWSVEELTKSLYLAPESVKEILDDLVRQRLIEASIGIFDCYHYEPASNLDPIVALVDSAYRRELIRITRLIHSKPSAAVREFARAFRIKRDQK